MTEEWHHSQIHSVSDHIDYKFRFLWLSPDYSTDIRSSADIYDLIKFSDGATHFMKTTFLVPSDFVSFDSLHLYWLAPDKTKAQIATRLETAYAAPGELYSTHGERIDETFVTGGYMIITEMTWNAKKIFLDLSAGDICGIKFSRFGASIYDTLDANAFVLGLEFRYVGHQ